MKIFVLTCLAACALSGQVVAQELTSISLRAPRTSGGTTILEALSQRQSTRAYAPQMLTDQELSDLLWAANGINRPESKKRTAPSALNYQDVDVYVCLEKGAYWYDAKANKLEPIINEDLRKLVANGQDFAASAPVVLVLTSDLSKMKGGDTETNRLLGAMDAGIVSQNISLACAGLGLATVPRGTMDKASLAKKLRLKDSQVLLLNHPVGHFVK